MKKQKQRINQGLIVLNKGERIAVISLLSIIVIFWGISIFRPSLPLSKKENKAFHNLDSMIAAQEQALAEQQAAKLVETPTHTTERPAPTRHASKPTTKAMYTTPKTESKPVNTAKKVIPILDINTADSLTLTALPQIGEVMSSRIHRYRNRLGGFVSFEQLFEIKGMDSARYNTIMPYLIMENTEIIKINVNQDEFKTLLRHPYLEYDQVKAIVNHRERKGFIRNWNQLKEIIGEVNPLLEAYVTY